jgi:hypothetical protein
MSRALQRAGWPLKKSRSSPTRRSRVLLLRQTVGVALIRAGARLAAGPRAGVPRDTAPVEGTLSTTG